MSQGLWTAELPPQIEDQSKMISKTNRKRIHIYLPRLGFGATIARTVIPLLHPTLFALLLTLAAIGTPLVCTGSSMVFGSSKIVTIDSDFIHGKSDIRANARAIRTGNFAFEHQRTTEKLRCSPIFGLRFRSTLVWEQYLLRTFRLDESRPWKGLRTLKDAQLRAFCVQLLTL